MGGGDTNQAVLQRKDTRPKQSLALPSISWDTPTIPYQAQGSSQHSLSFCQQVSDFSRRKMCLVFFFFFVFLFSASQSTHLLLLLLLPTPPSFSLLTSLSPSLFSLPLFSPPFFPSSLGSGKSVHTQLDRLPWGSPSETLTATVRI